MARAGTFVHATALVVGEAGVVIRGPSGAGKSRLAQLLLDEAPLCGTFARLVGDDRVLVRVAGTHVVASPHPDIAGLLERRTQPFGRLPYENGCVVRLVVDLHPPTVPLPRAPDADEATADLAGLGGLPLLRLQGPPDALSCRLVLEALRTRLDTVDEP